MKWINLCIIFALIFGGGLCLALDHVMAAVLLYCSGIALYRVLDNRDLLPE